MNSILELNLGEVIKVLPYPQSLSDVLKWGEKKEFNDFRSVLNTWLMYVDKKEWKLEEKIRKDLNKASKSLKTVEKWEKYNNSNLCFFINSIVGQIPVASNILTGMYTLVGFTADNYKQKYSWFKFLN